MPTDTLSIRAAQEARTIAKFLGARETPLDQDDSVVTADALDELIANVAFAGSSDDISQADAPKYVDEIVNRVTHELYGPEITRVNLSDSVSKTLETIAEALALAKRKQKIREMRERRAKAQQAINHSAAQIAFGATDGVLRHASWLGKPKSGSPSPGGTFYYQQFDFGEIRVRPQDLGDYVPEPCEYLETDIYLAAAKCFGTDDPGLGPFTSPSDEIYMFAVLFNPDAALCGKVDEAFRMWESPTYKGVTPDNGGIFARDVPMFDDVVVGVNGIGVKIGLFEEEHGSREAIRSEISRMIKAVTDSANSVAKALTGIDIKSALEKADVELPIIDELKDLGSDSLANLLKDDFLGEKNFFMPGGLLKEWAHGGLAASGVDNGRDLPASVATNIPRDPFDPYWLYGLTSGGTYKLYLRAIPVQVRYGPDQP